MWYGSCFDHLVTLGLDPCWLIICSRISMDYCYLHWTSYLSGAASPFSRVSTFGFHYRLQIDTSGDQP
jgi:hypothetical protein